ncbi:ROK family transcriptional regulator [Mangrovicella endophytica]|uniref:ROK family transcriptional regulator n=1 Tax=Mangrovicella endophytica TaxID=2066697 RepID=UPI000C9E6C05|nr:ROK family transcriptional regulator [Mangrovicella endophytica]
MSTRDGEVTTAHTIRAKRGANLTGANAHNRRIVIDALRVNGALSRADLARATGLSGQTVSNLVGDLERQGLLVADLPLRGKGRGQPATPYRLLAEGAYAIGVQIDRHATRAVAIDLMGVDLVRLEASLPKGGPEVGLPVVIKLIEEVRTRLKAIAPAADGRLVGLGVAMPGPVGVISAADDPWMMSAWQTLPLADYLNEATGLDVAFRNDASAAAIAEKLSGAARGLDDFVYLYLGYGLGAGLMVRGEIHAGAAGNAGEIGMVLSSPFASGRPVEHVASIAVLCRELDIDPADPALFKRLDDAVGAGHARAWISEAAPMLRWAIHTLETLLDPATIVFGGSVPPSLLASLHDAMQPLLPSLADNTRRIWPRLVLGRGDPWMVAVGAAAEPIARTFEPRFSAVQSADPGLVAAVGAVG